MVTDIVSLYRGLRCNAIVLAIVLFVLGNEVSWEMPLYGRLSRGIKRRRATQYDCLDNSAQEYMDVRTDIVVEA